MVLAMRHGVLPKTLHVDEPTPHVDWSAGRGAAAHRGRSRGPRPAGRAAPACPAFGISGTNAHAIFEQPSEVDAEPAAPVVRRDTVPWLLAGDTEAAVRAQAASLGGHLDAHPGLSPLDVGFSLATTRSALRFRAVAVGRDRAELRRELAAIADGTAPAAPGAPRR